MNSSIAKTLLVAAVAALAMAANAQTTAPAGPAADKKAMAESDAKAYKEGRIACKKLTTGAERTECRKKLVAKYVDKQCGNLSGDKLDACIEGEYPGE